MTNNNNAFDLFEMFGEEIEPTTNKDVQVEAETVVTPVEAENEVISEPISTTSDETVEATSDEVVEPVAEVTEDCSNDNETEEPTSFVIKVTETISESATPEEKAENDFAEAVADAQQAADAISVSIIDAFGELSKKADEAEVVAQKAVDEVAAKKAEAVSKAKVEKEEDFSVNELTVIRHFGKEYPLTDYFSAEEIAEGIKIENKDKIIEHKKIDGEIVRARLEGKGFYEFIKGHTEMKYVGKKKNFILPLIVAKKKGNCEVNEEVLSSSDDTVSFLFPNKIPSRLFVEFCNLAKLLAPLNLEVRGEFYFNWDTNEYSLHIPHQVVHEYWVTSKEAPGQFVLDMLEEKGEQVQLACEIHSHHKFPPIASATDNEGEQQPTMFYCIVGCIHEAMIKPDWSLRSFTLEHTYKEWALNEVFIDDGTTFAYSVLPSDFDALKIHIERG